MNRVEHKYLFVGCVYPDFLKAPGIHRISRFPYPRISLYRIFSSFSPSRPLPVPASRSAVTCWRDDTGGKRISQVAARAGPTGVWIRRSRGGSSGCGQIMETLSTMHPEGLTENQESYHPKQILCLYPSILQANVAPTCLYATKATFISETIYQ